MVRVGDSLVPAEAKPPHGRFRARILEESIAFCRPCQQKIREFCKIFRFFRLPPKNAANRGTCRGTRPTKQTDFTGGKAVWLVKRSTRGEPLPHPPHLAPTKAVLLSLQIAASPDQEGERLPPARTVRPSAPPPPETAEEKEAGVFSLWPYQRLRPKGRVGGQDKGGVGGFAPHMQKLSAKKVSPCRQDAYHTPRKRVASFGIPVQNGSDQKGAGVVRLDACQGPQQKGGWAGKMIGGCGGLCPPHAKALRKEGVPLPARRMPRCALGDRIALQCTMWV